MQVLIVSLTTYFILYLNTADTISLNKLLICIILFLLGIRPGIIIKVTITLMSARLLSSYVDLKHLANVDSSRFQSSFSSKQIASNSN